MTSASTGWRISNSAILKLVGTAAVVFVVVRLYPLFMLLALAILLACTLHPGIKKLETKMPHWLACGVVTIAVLLLLAGTLGGVIPKLRDQFSAIGKKLPETQAAILKNVPSSLSTAAERFLRNPTLPAENIAKAGQYVLGAISEFVLMVVLALYLAADGERLYQWLTAFFSPAHRKKLNETTKEACEIIVAYVAGQLVTSLLASLFVLVVLSLLKVPAALVLAVLAGVFDVLPLLGFFLFAIPAVVFALSVSLQTALLLLVLYLAYHLIENYFIVPKVYGNRLRLSDLAVLISVLAGGYLAGIVGAILILPLVAVYPAIERIWLKDYIGRAVVERHEKVESP